MDTMLILQGVVLLIGVALIGWGGLRVYKKRFSKEARGNKSNSE